MNYLADIKEKRQLIANDEKRTAELLELNDAIKKLSTVLKSIKIPEVKKEKAETGEFKKAIKDVISAINRIDLKPVINVPAPKITTKSTTVDLKPLQRTLEKHFETKDHEIELSCFRAQDLDEAEIGVQLVGFVSPDGVWYIIRNDETSNTLRYKFGKKNYAKAWAKASSFEYKLLNEAIREIQT